VPFVRADGCKVFTTTKTISIYDTDGKLLRQENIVDYTKANVRGHYGDLSKFIRTWSEADKKEAIAAALAEQAINLDKLKHDMQLDDVDDYDFICHVAFDQKPLTRRERANNVKKRDFLSRYSGAARQVLEALLEKYQDKGVYEIESTEILKLDPFMKLGKPSKIASYFGGKEGYLKAVRELEALLYDEDIA
jgi:type I restriction enzyme R subunit